MARGRVPAAAAPHGGSKATPAATVAWLAAKVRVMEGKLALTMRRLSDLASPGGLACEGGVVDTELFDAPPTKSDVVFPSVGVAAACPGPSSRGVGLSPPPLDVDDIVGSIFSDVHLFDNGDDGMSIDEQSWRYREATMRAGSACLPEFPFPSHVELRSSDQCISYDDQATPVASQASLTRTSDVQHFTALADQIPIAIHGSLTPPAAARDALPTGIFSARLPADGLHANGANQYDSEPAGPYLDRIINDAHEHFHVLPTDASSGSVCPLAAAVNASSTDG
mmetsp:Transcript_83452/g.244667  ORF Transcript_83452/g.244667 Transcript_83452/m.244667 type:complete len:281 (+) Transcript_83452:102-944(+)